LSIGVVADAFVVRMIIVPAAVALLGRAAWWLPRWLDRLLPHLDPEGRRVPSHVDTPAKEPALAGDRG
jgi:putative drug exporter of the RND superfamily